MRRRDRLEQRRHLEELRAFEEEVRLCIEAFATFSRQQLQDVVRTRPEEAAVTAAVRLLTTKFRMTVMEDGEDAEFVPPRRKNAAGVDRN